MDGRPWARFDDLAAGEALLCPPPSRVLTAVRPEDVAGVLQEFHDATREGSWAFGYVAHEAAAGLETQLPGVERGRLLERDRLQERRLTVGDLWRAERIAVHGTGS